LLNGQFNMTGSQQHGWPARSGGKNVAGGQNVGMGMMNGLNGIKNWPELGRQSNWGAVALAKKCDVSIRTMERHFLKNMGRTPKKWLSEQRQKQARELLADGASIKETAAELGYKHAHHFSRGFKRYWGISPSRVNLNPAQTG
jgi:transcriptional regulator GlxA family with amidase domain